MVGGDPALQFAGKNADQKTILDLQHQLGLDLPLPQQYFIYLSQTLRMDWGRSWITGQPVHQMMRDGLLPTIQLMLPAFLISLLISISIALVSSYKKSLDQIIVISSLSLMSVSFLVYIIVLQKWLAYDLNIFPIYGWNNEAPWSFIMLPGLIYILASVGPKTIVFRSLIMSEVSKDYVRTAHAKGLAPWSVYTTHVLLNALPSIITLVCTQLPALFMGSLLLEAYFGIPGLGGLLAKSIHGSDFPVIKAITVTGSLIYILFTFLNDLTCRYLDPRSESP